MNPPSPNYEPSFSLVGAACWGAVPWETLFSLRSEEALSPIYQHCPTPTGIFIAAFPYFAGDTPGNLSLYARGADYHTVVTQALAQICQELQEQYPGCHCHSSADVSPLPEVSLAVLAGMGVLGKQGLLLVPDYGSYVFLGTIVTDCPYPFPPPQPVQSCISCGLCVRHCPGQALSSEGLNLNRCLSHLTQSKEPFSTEQGKLVDNHPLIWGCDSCQRVCPYNLSPKLSPLSAFREDLVDTLQLEQVAGQTRKQFLQAFPDRAFTWRGAKVLERNLILHQTNSQ